MKISIAKQAILLAEKITARYPLVIDSIELKTEEITECNGDITIAYLLLVKITKSQDLMCNLLTFNGFKVTKSSNKSFLRILVSTKAY